MTVIYSSYIIGLNRRCDNWHPLSIHRTHCFDYWNTVTYFSIGCQIFFPAICQLFPNDLWPVLSEKVFASVFWHPKHLHLTAADINAWGPFSEHFVSRTLAPVQLSKLAGINLADDIIGHRQSFIFISVLFLEGEFTIRRMTI